MAARSAGFLSVLQDPGLYSLPVLETQTIHSLYFVHGNTCVAVSSTALRLHFAVLPIDIAAHVVGFLSRCETRFVDRTTRWSRLRFYC